MTVRMLRIDTQVSAQPVRVCAGFWTRLRGYGRGRTATDGVWLEPCAAVHTLWPRRCLDVVFVSDAGLVLRICPALRPGRVRGCPGARAVLELPAGRSSLLGIGVGTRLAVSDGA